MAQLCVGGVFVEFSRDNSSYLAIRGPIVNVIGQRDKNIVPQEVHAMRGGSVRCTLTIRPPHRLRLPCKIVAMKNCSVDRVEVHKFTEHRSYRCQIIEIRPRSNFIFPKIFSSNLPSSFVPGLSTEYFQGVKLSRFHALPDFYARTI